MAQQDTYKDLLDSPNETLEVEYKSWLDLNDNETRADLARHIAAIANHGGGMIVFGLRDDDLQFAGPNPHGAPAISRDLISSIVKKYLEPPFQCDVEFVRSSAGNVHPVVRVPPHGSSPICAKSNGPERDGKARGIAQGMYYTRKPGPESERILTAAEWAPIIRRCALHERAGILSAIEVTLRGEAQGNVGGNQNDLDKWHDAAFAQFKKDVATSAVPKELAERNVQYSYSILRADGQRLDHQALRDSLIFQINSEVKDRVRTGWSMFHPFTRPELAPRFAVDPESGEGQEDFVECALMRAKDRSDFSTDMWRITTGGKATLIRSYWEDEADWLATIGAAPGTLFGPRLHVRAVAEFLRHAQAFAEKFDSPVSVSVICEWRGLAGRILYDQNAFYLDPGRAVAENRQTTADVPTAALATAWPDIVSQLVAPVVRLFNSSSLQVTPSYVRGQAPTWLR